MHLLSVTAEKRKMDTFSYIFDLFHDYKCVILFLVRKI